MLKPVISIASCLTTVLAAPIEDDFTSWHSEPDGRGTWSILSSCVLTLVLCVYTAVHMNVPAASQTEWQRQKHMAGWVCAGIFAPELVVWTAWQQWSDARRLTKKVRAFAAGLGDDPEKGHLRRFLESWTIKHSFFVVMGGYQFRPEVQLEWAVDEPKRTRWGRIFYWGDDHRWPKCVLTPNGLMKLLDQGKGDQIPILTAQDIDDRSKADNLAKLLSCVQGLWLIIQLISRLASNLTITELEVNTLAHVICAISMYAFWMKKPLKIEQPVWLDSEYLREWAFVYGAIPTNVWISLRYTQARCQNRSKQTGHSVKITAHKLHPLRQPKDCSICIQNGIASDQGYDRLVLVLAEDVTMDLEDVISSLNSIPAREFGFDFVYFGNNISEEGSILPFEPLHVNQSLLNVLLKLWSSPELDVYLEARTAESSDESFGPELWYSSRMVTSQYRDNELTLSIMVMVSSLYGGLYAALWQHHFPTVAELWMWRISSLVVAGNGLVLALFIIISFWGGEWGDKVRQRTEAVCGTSMIWFPIDTVCKLLIYVVDRETTLAKCLFRLLCIVFWSLQFIFVCCRVFLFIEAFISLRSQPQSAYDTPNWSQWLPHF